MANCLPLGELILTAEKRGAAAILPAEKKREQEQALETGEATGPRRKEKHAGKKQSKKRRRDVSRKRPNLDEWNGEGRLTVGKTRFYYLSIVTFGKTLQ